MKRVVEFQEKDTANEAEWEFKDSRTENKKRKHNSSNKKDKFNAKTKRLSHADFVQKKEEMLAFRKQLPIYTGIYRALACIGRRIDTICNVGRDAIIQCLEENDTVIVMGETGSGKTTRKSDFLM